MTFKATRKIATPAGAVPDWPLSPLPSQLSSIGLTTTPEPEPEKMMPGGPEQSWKGKEKTRKEIRCRIVETDEEEDSTEQAQINAGEPMRRWRNGVSVN